MATELDEIVVKPIREAVGQYAKILVEFIYESVEQSRRRSLREMWLAARDSESGEQLRSRILDFLSEGDLSPVVNDLLEGGFDFRDWQNRLAEITDIESAEQWRGVTAHELESDPNHTGLLLGRGLSELLVARPNTFEADRNLRSALDGASQRFGLDNEQVADMAVWLCRWATGRPPIVVGTIIGTVRSMNLDHQRVREAEQILLRQTISEFPSDPGIAVLALGERLEIGKVKLDELMPSMAGRWE